MKIRKVNEDITSKYDKYFTVSDEDIEDFSIELLDSGYNIRVHRLFKKRGDSFSGTDEPISDKAEAYYEIDYYPRKDANSNCIVNDIQKIKDFLSAYNRIQKMIPNKDVYYKITTNSTCEFSIYVILEARGFELGFDFGTFSEDVKKFVEETYSRDYTGDIYGHPRGKRIDSFSYNSNQIDITLYDPDRSQIVDKIQKGDCDNKFLYDDIKKQLDEFLTKSSKYIQYSIELQQHDSTITVNVKTGFLRKEKRKYTPYELTIRIKKKSNT